MKWDDWAGDELAKVRVAGRWRQVRALDGRGPEAILDGRSVVSFASNDYLGLTTHPAVIAAAHDALDRWGSGAGSARLIVGSRPIHHELEEAIADWRQCSRALLFPTGYSANLGVLSALGGPDVTVVSDELNHASIIDGCRLSRSRALSSTRTVISTPASVHCAPAKVAASSSPTPSSRWMVTSRPWSNWPTSARRTTRSWSSTKPTRCSDPNCRWRLAGLSLLRIGTLSKTLGALGGYVAGADAFIDLIVNRSRPFIFTTAPTPADTAAALAALAICRSDEGDALRAHLRCHIARVRRGHPSPIVPVMLGDESSALTAAAALLEQGLLVPAIRPPTVPAGTCRLRVALSAAHTDEMVGRLVAALATIDPAARAGPNP